MHFYTNSLETINRSRKNIMGNSSASSTQNAIMNAVLMMMMVIKMTRNYGTKNCPKKEILYESSIFNNDAE